MLLSKETFNLTFGFLFYSTMLVLAAMSLSHHYENHAVSGAILGVLGFTGIMTCVWGLVKEISETKKDKTPNP